MEKNVLKYMQTNLQDIIEICDEDIHECEKERILTKTISIKESIDTELLHSSDLEQTNELSERALKIKMPVGTIACPHCGTVSHGAINTHCGMCNKSYFEKVNEQIKIR